MGLDGEFAMKLFRSLAWRQFFAEMKSDRRWFKSRQVLADDEYWHFHEYRFVPSKLHFLYMVLLAWLFDYRKFEWGIDHPLYTGSDFWLGYDDKSLDREREMFESWLQTSEQHLVAFSYLWQDSNISWKEKFFAFLILLCPGRGKQLFVPTFTITRRYIRLGPVVVDLKEKHWTIVS